MIKTLQRNYWVRLVLAADVIAAAIIAAVILDLRTTNDAPVRTPRIESVETEDTGVRPVPEQPEAPNPTIESRPSTPPTVKPVIKPETTRGAVVRYTGSAFDPASVTVEDGSNRSGCFIAFVNESNATLLLRLAPFSPNDNYGFLYPPIAPGKSGTIDPRYRGIPDPVFYDRNNRAAMMQVHLLATCQL